MVQKKIFLTKKLKIYSDNLYLKIVKVEYITQWGEMWGSNPRIPEPQSGVLTTSPIPP